MNKREGALGSFHPCRRELQLLAYWLNSICAYKLNFSDWIDWALSIQRLDF